MTQIIAILFLLGQFEVTVETSKGYFVSTHPDTEAGLAQFLRGSGRYSRPEAGRFYPCVAYDGPVQDLLNSVLAERIGVVANLISGVRTPGIADAPWIVRTIQ